MFPQWRSLPKEERDKYYEEAKKEKQLHAERHPGWSGACNYVSTQHRDAECNAAPEVRKTSTVCTSPVSGG